MRLLIQQIDHNSTEKRDPDMIATEYHGITKATIEPVIVAEGTEHPEGKHYTRRPTFILECNCNTPKEQDEAPRPVRPVLHRKMTAREIQALQFPVRY